MKRLYRITVVIEHEFGRKATREVRAAKDRLMRCAIGPGLYGWTMIRASVSSSAKTERKTPTPKPNPEREAMDLWYEVALKELRAIAADMAAILGNVKKPRIEYAPNRWCDGKFTHNTAHAHIHNNVRWVRDRSLAGKRAGRKIPKGLICISKRNLRRMDTRRFPWLMAHEIMHVRMPGGSHRRAKFNENADDLLATYYRVKGIAPPDFAEPRVRYGCASCRAISLPGIGFKECPVCHVARTEAGVFAIGTPDETIDRYLGFATTEERHAVMIREANR